MTLSVLLLQILLSVPLSIILKFIDKKNSDATKLLVPTVYIIILSALIPYIKQNIFLIVVFEIFIRNFYVTNIAKERNTKNNILFIIESLISIFIALVTYNYFISKVDTVIPNPEEIKAYVWFLVIIFIYMIYHNMTKDKIENKKQKELEFKNENIVMEYAKYKNKYYSLISSKNKMVNDMAYAIMIYNSKKRPAIYRKIDEYKGMISRKEIPYGIMQIKSYHHLTDEESIKLCMEQLEEKYKNTDKKLDSILSNYSDEDRKTIIAIYAEIVEFTKK